MLRVRKQIGVPAALEGSRGCSFSIAVLDSGVAGHPDLNGRLLDFQDYVHHRESCYDDNGHGTHICGIISGDGTLSKGQYCGMAPGTGLVVGKVLDEKGNGYAEHMLKALDWIGRVREQYNIRIINISVGIGSLSCTSLEKELKAALERLWKEGMIVVCAAGNKGPENGSISAIGDSNCVIIVGCHDGEYFQNNPRRCDAYSGRGILYSPIRKPDVVAPGTDIVSCNAFYRRRGDRRHAPYVAKSGTSMAAPIVAGAAALTLMRYPFMTNYEFKQKLTRTATDLKEPWNKQGWGMVNVQRLLE